MLAVVKRLSDEGVPTEQVRSVIEELRNHDNTELSQIMLVSDGADIYWFSTAEDIVSFLSTKQAAFGISLGDLWIKLSKILAEAPAENPVSPNPDDNPELPTEAHGNLAFEVIAGMKILVDRFIQAQESNKRDAG